MTCNHQFKEIPIQYDCQSSIKGNANTILLAKLKPPRVPLPLGENTLRELQLSLIFVFLTIDE